MTIQVVSAKYSRIVTSKARNAKIKEIVSGDHPQPVKDFFVKVFETIKAASHEGKGNAHIPHPGNAVAEIAHELLPALGYEAYSTPVNMIVSW